MSGSFNEIDVPPTLVSFAVDTGKLLDVVDSGVKKQEAGLYASCAKGCISAS